MIWMLLIKEVDEILGTSLNCSFTSLFNSIKSSINVVILTITTNILLTNEKAILVLKNELRNCRKI